MNVTVKKNTVIINGLSIEFDTLARVNSFLLDYIDVHGGAVDKIEEIKENDVLTDLIFEYGLIEIENLDLSVRAYNVLKRAGVNYIQDILRMEYDTVSRIRNMGSLSMIEIQGTINRFVRYDYINWSSNLNIVA